MRIRVEFEYGTSVCLWADDAAARDRWTSAVEPGQVALSAALVGEANRLQAELESHYVGDGGVFEARWSDAEREAFHAWAAAWAGRVREELAAAGIEVAPYGAAPGLADPVSEGKEFEGCVLACFTDVESRAAADRKESASTGWAEVAVWNGDIFKLRAS